MKDVLLKITGAIVRYEKGSEVCEDVMEFITEGKLGNKGRTTLLSYPEMEDTGLSECTTHLTITSNKVKMHRKNEEKTQSIMEFEIGKRYNGLYMTPQGPLKMELLTNSISPFGEDEKMSIDYTMTLKGLAESHNKLNIEVLRNL